MCSLNKYVIMLSSSKIIYIRAPAHVIRDISLRIQIIRYELILIPSSRVTIKKNIRIMKSFYSTRIMSSVYTLRGSIQKIVI